MHLISLSRPFGKVRGVVLATWKHLDDVLAGRASMSEKYGRVDTPDQRHSGFHRALAYLHFLAAWLDAPKPVTFGEGHMTLKRYGAWLQPFCVLIIRALPTTSTFQAAVCRRRAKPRRGTFARSRSRSTSTGEGETSGGFLSRRSCPNQTLPAFQIRALVA